ncbi:hypothetical protein H4CHR_02838 [Variovorax sp. PBS-H4]|uniref:hypothetical protein n=1 Tax=Variovorax sp. PBS-H4 TaxID=434008 RepID=UPI00131805AA|nr:hypothetical protein [Variovorax sp. PBS-H4]VTU31592.1 hypothetical protein H4CHR_02838 [Variovorax sp. PBS-H4]
MATSSILGGEHAPREPRGTDVDSLGPSDTSDSGSDVQTDRSRTAMPDGSAEGALPIAHGSDTDSTGTGERASADPTAASDDADILPDRIGTVPYDAGEVTDEVEDPTAAAAEELAEDTDDLDAGDDEDEAGDDGDGGSAPLGRAVPVRRGT